MTPTSPGDGGSRRAAPWRSHRVQNGLVFAALLIEFVLLVGHPLFGWFTTHYAATPAPLVAEPAETLSARAELELLAGTARIAGPPNRSSRASPYAFVEWRQWQLSSGRAGAIPTQIVPSLYRSWLGPTGAHVVSERMLARSGPMATARFTRDQGPAIAGDQTSLAGLGFVAPTVPAAIQHDFLNVLALATRQPLDGGLAARILSFLAGLPGVIDNGQVIDRAGLPGVAISLDSTARSPSLTYTLVFRASDGALLEEDTTVSTDDDQLHVRAGAVVGYTVLLDGGWTAKLGGPP